LAKARWLRAGLLDSTCALDNHACRSVGLLRPPDTDPIDASDLAGSDGVRRRARWSVSKVPRTCIRRSARPGRQRRSRSRLELNGVECPLDVLGSPDAGESPDATWIAVLTLAVEHEAHEEAVASCRTRSHMTDARAVRELLCVLRRANVPRLREQDPIDSTNVAVDQIEGLERVSRAAWPRGGKARLIDLVPGLVEEVPEDAAERGDTLVPRDVLVVSERRELDLRTVRGGVVGCVLEGASGLEWRLHSLDRDRSLDR
jgi:hypothetical protein